MTQICDRRLDSGLTLIEVLVATALLAMASFMIYSVVIGSFDTNRKLGIESDTYLGLSVSMQALDRDIAQIYSPVIGATTPPPDLSPQAFWSVPLRPDGLRRTRFVGTREKISFIATSNRRLQTDARESDLIKVVWEIVRNKDNTYALTRHADVNVFDYEDESPSDRETTRLTVLDNLSTAKFTFLKNGKETFEESWDSEAPSTEDSSRFPVLIALDITYPNPENTAVPMAWRSEFAPMFDLNGTINKLISTALQGMGAQNNTQPQSGSGTSTSGTPSSQKSGGG